MCLFVGGISILIYLDIMVMNGSTLPQIKPAIVKSNAYKLHCCYPFTFDSHIYSATQSNLERTPKKTDSIDDSNQF